MNKVRLEDEHFPEVWLKTCKPHTPNVWMFECISICYNPACPFILVIKEQVVNIKQNFFGVVTTASESFVCIMGCCWCTLTCLHTEMQFYHYLWMYKSSSCMADWLGLQRWRWMLGSMVGCTDLWTHSFIDIMKRREFRCLAQNLVHPGGVGSSDYRIFLQSWHFCNSDSALYR